MSEGLVQTGAFSHAELSRLPGMPSSERLGEGAVAVIECAEEIPCNPCELACRSGAIRIGEDITKVPKLLEERCNGCGLCIPSCPGLAIFVVDTTYSPDEALIQLLYELLPVPEEGSTVRALNREGVEVSKARVVRVIDRRVFDRTLVIAIAVPKELAMEVRSFSL